MIDIPTGSVLAIVGATATGKSDLALDIAERNGGEIINADAMQLYRGMDIGTAKVPLTQRRGIPHHQLDVLRVTQEASVAAYQHHARADIDRVLSTGGTPILVGGSGLYLRAVLEHFEFPPTDQEVRGKIEERLHIQGPGLLHDELSQKDPVAAAQINRANGRRIVRALEVIELTGQPFSASLPDPTYVYPTVALGVDVGPDELDDRINRRAHTMFEAGLVQETQGLLDHGLAQGKTASKAVGYQQAIDVIAGKITEAEAINAVALATRQLARRQRKWFKRDSRIEWITP